MFEIVGFKKIRMSKNEATFQVCIHQKSFVGTLPRLCLCTVYSGSELQWQSGQKGNQVAHRV